MEQWQDLWEFLTDLSQPWATLLASFVVGTGAFLGFRVSMKSHKREVLAARHTRYTTIAEQLSSDHETVRLAGVYALSALADEWQMARNISQRDVAAELLCAYLRADPRTSKGRESIGYKDREVRAAIISIIRAHRVSAARPFWLGCLVNLSGADLSRADLSRADLESVDLWEANLSDANLRGANLSRAILQTANLSRANLSRASLSRANLSGTDLRAANLMGANLSLANLLGANLSWANLSGANLSEAHLSVADLSETDLSEANLAGANLAGANLAGANLAGAILTGVDRATVDLSTAVNVPEDRQPAEPVEPGHGQ